MLLVLVVNGCWFQNKDRADQLFNLIKDFGVSASCAVVTSDKSQKDVCVLVAITSHSHRRSEKELLKS